VAEKFEDGNDPVGPALQTQGSDGVYCSLPSREKEKLRPSAQLLQNSSYLQLPLKGIYISFVHAFA
jgi:hypothetical protein